MEPDWDKLLEELNDQDMAQPLWQDMSILGRAVFMDLYLPILKRHFEQFEKDIIAKLQKELDEVMYDSQGPYVGSYSSVFAPMCPGIADTQLGHFGPEPQTLLEALRKGAENPVVDLTAPCPVCVDLASYCSYCARGLEE